MTNFAKIRRSFRVQIFFCLINLFWFLIACEPEKIGNDDCYFSQRSSCSGFAFSFVNPNTYENLLGSNGQPIHPDSVVITNTRRDTMYHELYSYSDGWNIIANFSPLQEITCFINAFQTPLSPEPITCT